jgi:hypothetical protein
LSDLKNVLTEAREWLAFQPAPLRGSATWYGLNRLEVFLNQIEADPSRQSLESAIHALNQHISDQYGAYDELPTIATFNNRVRRIAKGLAWQEYRAGPDYNPLG